MVKTGANSVKENAKLFRMRQQKEYVFALEGRSEQEREGRSKVA